MFLIDNAFEILSLAAGLALVALAIWLFVLTGTLLKLNRILGRVNSLLDLFEHYIHKPLQLIVGAEKMYRKFFKK